MGTKRNTLLKKSILAVMLCISMLAASLPPIASPAAIAVVAASGGETSMAFVIGRNTYTVNGVTITMDVSPTVIEDRTMLPIRFVAEPLGASVNWDEATSKVTVQLMDTKIELWIGQSNALVNGATTPIDPDNPNVRPLTLNDRTMLPVRFVTENLGCDVGWDEATQQVTVVRYAGGGASTAPAPEATPESPGGGEDEPEGENAEGENADDLDKENSFKLTAIAMIEKVPRLTVTGVAAAISRGMIGSRTMESDTIPAALEPTREIKTMKLSDLEEIKPLKDIGRGYDVFGRYASGLSLKNAVLDVDGPNGLIANGQVQRTALYAGDFREIEGETLEEYAKDMTATAKVSGGFLGFKASVETSFNSSYRSKSTSYYDTINYLVMEDSLFIKGSCNYKDYVLPNVKAILDTGRLDGRTFTSNDIFDTYGGYVLVDGVFGGRLEYNVTANSEFCDSYSNFKANVMASYNAGFGSVSGNVDSGTTTHRSEFLSNSSTTVMTYGGSAQDGKALTGAQLYSSAIQAWRDSIPSRSTLVEFGETGSRALIPIWSLCTDSGRAKKLEEDFEIYAKANGRTIILPPRQKYIEWISFVSGSSREIALAKIEKDNPGYMPTYVSLNAPSSIYLVYNLTDDIRYAIGDLFLELSPDALPCQQTTRTHNGNKGLYFRSWQNLNSPSSEYFDNVDYIYLNFAKYILLTDKQEGVKPITQIEVVTSLTDPSPAGWTYVKWQNTNEAADCSKNNFGGTSCYIRYR